jgi:hypothetical protein
MTYEQGGINGGLGIINKEGDTLTLVDRIEHHHTTGMSTVEMASKHATTLNSEFAKYFATALNGGNNAYKFYVVKNDDSWRSLALAQLLNKNGINYHFAENSNLAQNGLNYFTNKQESFKLNNKDVIIPAAQASSNLLSVLFERNSKLNDSITYDITSWSLPYAYGLQTFGCNTLSYTKAKTITANTNSLSANAYALLIPYNGMPAAKLVAALLQKGIKLRFAEKDFIVNKKNYAKGTIIITKAANKKNALVMNEYTEWGVQAHPVNSGFVEKGSDFGSDLVHTIQTPKVALVTGASTSSLAVGEVWHYFDKELNYPITLIDNNNLSRSSLNNFNTLIIANGRYEFLQKNSFVRDWVAAGGKLIAVGEIVADLAANEWGGLKLKEDKENKDDPKKEPNYSLLKKYEQRERDDISSYNPGSTFKIELDNTHPLAYGYPNYYYTNKQDTNIFEYLKSGWNVGYFKKGNYVSGFVGDKVKSKLQDGTLIGMAPEGRGQIIFFAENPLFRGFWENGKLFIANALFFAAQ